MIDRRSLLPPSQATMILQRRTAAPSAAVNAKAVFPQSHPQARLLQRRVSEAAPRAVPARIPHQGPKVRVASPAVRIGSIQRHHGGRYSTTGLCGGVVQRAVQYGGNFAPLGGWHQALVYFSAAMGDPKGHREGGAFFRELSNSNNTDILFNTGPLGGAAEGETDIQVLQNGVWISLETNPGNVNWSNIDDNTQIRVVITVDPAAKPAWDNGLILQVLNHEFNVHARFYNKIIPLLREQWITGTKRRNAFQNRTTNTGPVQHYDFGQGWNLGYNKTNSVLTNLLTQQPPPGPIESVSMNNESQQDILNHMLWFPNKPY